MAASLPSRSLETATRIPLPSPMRPVRRQSSQAFEDRRVTDEALEAAVRLSDRYITGRFMPDKAIDVMDEAGAHQLYNSAAGCERDRAKYRDDPRRERSGDKSPRL